MKSILKPILLGVLIFISSCKEDKPNNKNSKAPLVIDLNAVVSTMPLELQTTLYTDHLNRNYKVELLKFYMTNWKLEKTDGSLIMLNEINLVDFSLDEPLNIEADIETGTYVNLHFGIGLDPSLNASDPVDFESSHPLSVAQNTYWTWVSKYKFFMLEGRVDAQGGTEPNSAFSYHTGFDEMYREVSISLDNLVFDNSGDSLHLELDVSKIINGTNGTIDFVTENSSHSLDESGLTEIISDNLVNSFTLQ
tara:strand:- start:435 stop:1184 length:750 start_codon:yes stop_codon:yes gene_type:complete